MEKVLHISFNDPNMIEYSTMVWKHAVKLCGAGDMRLVGEGGGGGEEKGEDKRN